jgi:aspartyl-tRNA(Asn)/glutamyl-tRNA(Gln) amidotransferase subunit A
MTSYRERSLSGDYDKQMSFDDLVPPPSFADVLSQHKLVMAVQAAKYHGERLRRHPDDYPPRITELIEEGLRHTATEYLAAAENMTQMSIEMDWFIKYKAILVTPATTDLAPDASTTGNPAFNSPWSYTGLPTVSVPIAWSDGLPFSIQIIGDEYGEARVFRVAARLEEIAGFERPPLPL